MSGFEIRADFSAFADMAKTFREAGNQAPHAIRRAVNYTGDRARTAMIRTLTGQTGLKRGTIVRALRVVRASYGAIEYRIYSRGGNVSLKYFGAKETRGGVVSKRGSFASAFMRGGRFPKRVALKLGGHAYQRTGKSRLPIKRVKSGVFIPKEMISGATGATFHASVAAFLPVRLAHEITAILKGHAPRG